MILGELHYRRLLVPIDGSPSADLALAAAVTVARRDNASITLMCVAPDLNQQAARWSWFGQVPMSTQEQEDEIAAKILRTAVDRIPEDLPVKTIVRRGRPGPEIVAHANETAYDAILMGGRGVGRVAALLGSVSNHVMHHSPIAVFVAHAPREEADVPASNP